MESEGEYKVLKNLLFRVDHNTEALHQHACERFNESSSVQIMAPNTFLFPGLLHIDHRNKSNLVST